MDSAEHQHGASAAPPPTAAPLPSESCNAKTKEPSAAAASTPASSTPVSTPKSAVPIAQTPPLQLSVPRNTATATKKRPLALVATISPALELSVPALKKNTAIGDNNKIVIHETEKKITVMKAKKTLKKKKKKFSSILSGMMKPKKTVDIQAERESLRKNLGGGNFAKIAKI